MNLRVCVCVWMEKVKGRWSSTMGPLHEIHLRLIPAWNPHISHASAGKTTALKNRFSSRKFKTSEAQFPLTWQLWFPSWMVEQRRQTGSGRTSLGALVRPPGQTNRFAVHRAFCMMLLRWPEMRVFFFQPLGESDAAILSVSHYVSVWQQSQLVRLRLESWTGVKRISQWVRTGG